MPENMDYSQPLIALRESKLDGLFECSSISKFVESAVFPAVLCVLFIVALVTHWDSTKKLNAPRIGKNPWLSGLTRARADFVKNGHSLTEEGYAKVNCSLLQSTLSTVDHFITVQGLHVLDPNGRHGALGSLESLPR